MSRILKHIVAAIRFVTKHRPSPSLEWRSVFDALVGSLVRGNPRPNYFPYHLPPTHNDNQCINLHLLFSSTAAQ